MKRRGGKGKMPSAKKEGGTGIMPSQFSGKKPKIDSPGVKKSREKRLSKMEM